MFVIVGFFFADQHEDDDGDPFTPYRFRYNAAMKSLGHANLLRNNCNLRRLWIGWAKPPVFVVEGFGPTTYGTIGRPWLR